MCVYVTIVFIWIGVHQDVLGTDRDVIHITHRHLLPTNDLSYPILRFVSNSIPCVAVTFYTAWKTRKRRFQGLSPRCMEASPPGRPDLYHRGSILHPVSTWKRAKVRHDSRLDLCDIQRARLQPAGPRPTGMKGIPARSLSLVTS